MIKKGISDESILKEASVKKPYEKMKVSLIGVVSNVVNKSGPDVDCSQQYDIKGSDSGDGQERNCSD